MGFEEAIQTSACDVQGRVVTAVAVTRLLGEDVER